MTALEAHGHDCGHLPSLPSLPCPLLSDLSLFELSLRQGFFSACPGLTSLLLKSCCVQDSPRASSSAASNPLTQLSVLSSLQHLSLRGVGRSATSLLVLPRSLLSQLVQLTYLQLGPGALQCDAALQHLSAVSGLQHLELTGRLHPTAAELAGLRHLQHLTALRLSVSWAVDLHSMPAVTALTALRVLQLWDIPSCDPAVLAGFNQLQQLDVMCRDPWDAEGSAALLAAIEQQAQLTGLELYIHRIWRPPSAAAFSALTASSSLQYLKLQNCQLPACAWQQMFPPTKCLPELRCLCLDARQEWGRGTALSCADMQAMVACCPALTCLRLGSQLDVLTTAPLQQLTGLTILRMDAPFQDSAHSIARLTGLQELTLDARQSYDRVTASGLLQLTVLQQLRSIVVTGAAYDPGLATSFPPEHGSFYVPDHVHIVNHAPAGAPADVWLQLKERCEAAQQVQAG